MRDMDYVLLFLALGSVYLGVIAYDHSWNYWLSIVMMLGCYYLASVCNEKKDVKKK